MNIRSVVEHGGSMTRLPTSTHEVSFWHIPDGARYDRATVHRAFFDSAAAADGFANKYSMPPEMAFASVVKQEIKK